MVNLPMLQPGVKGRAMPVSHDRWLLDVAEELLDEATRLLESERDPSTRLSDRLRALEDVRSRASILGDQIFQQGTALVEVLTPALVAAKREVPKDDADIFRALEAENELAALGVKLVAAYGELVRVETELASEIGAISLVAGDEVEGWAGHDSLGHALALLRESAGLSQAKLAEQLGISKTMVSHIESHRRDRRISVDTLFAWISKCNRSVRWQWARRDYEPFPERTRELVNRIRRMDEFGLDAIEALVEGLEARRARELL